MQNAFRMKEFDGMRALVAGGAQEMTNSGGSGALSLFDLDQAIGYARIIMTLS